MIFFHANCVAVEDNGLWMVGFADEEFATRQYLTLQRGFVDELGKCYAERDDQHWSCYDGIERFELRRDRVILLCNPDGMRYLETDGMDITFNIDEERFQKLLVVLQHTFADTDCLVIA